MSLTRNNHSDDPRSDVAAAFFARRVKARYSSTATDFQTASLKASSTRHAGHEAAAGTGGREEGERAAMMSNAHWSLSLHFAPQTLQLAKLDDLPRKAISHSVPHPPSKRRIQGFAVPVRVVTMLESWRPVLSQNPALLRFAVYLLATPFRDERSGQPLLSEQIIYRVFGYPVSYRSGEIPPVQQLLATYRQHVDTAFQWSKWDSTEGKSRIAVRFQIPHEIREAYTEGMEDAEEKKIIAPQMKTLNRRNRISMREDEREAAKGYDPEDAGGLPASDATMRVCRYMNSLPPRSFQPARAAHADMREAAKRRMPSRESRKQTVALVDRIGAQPVPVYRPADFTARPVAPNSLQQLPAPLREMAFSGSRYADLDLGKAQLAIAVRDWQDLAPEADTSLTEAMLREQLAGELNIWQDLQDFTGLEGEAGKAAVKRGTYGVVYGAGRGLEYAVREGYRAAAGEYPPKEKVSRFRQHPMIAELLEAREAALSAVRSAGGAEDAFGRWLPLDAFQNRPNPARSLLACLAQTRELWLMLPAFDLAEQEAEKTRPNFRIVLYVYDGITLKAQKRTDAQAEKVQQAVNERAEADGYLTRLERE